MPSARKPTGGLTCRCSSCTRAYDYICETLVSRLAEPMRAHCSNLTEVVDPSGHWMAQEKPVEVNAALAKWMGSQFPTSVGASSAYLYPCSIRA